MATSSVLCSEYLRCPVCLDLFRDPVTIPCGHSFCLECITQCWSLQGSSTSCPQCRCPFRMDSPSRLRKNSILSQMVDDFSDPLEIKAPTNLSGNIKQILELSHLQTAQGDQDAGSSKRIASPPFDRRNPEKNSCWASLFIQRREVTKGFCDMVRILQSSGFRLLQLMEQAECQLLVQDESRAQEQEAKLILDEDESGAMEEGLIMSSLLPSQVVPNNHQEQLKTEDGQDTGQEDAPWTGLSAAVSKFKEGLLELCAEHMGRIMQQVRNTEAINPIQAPKMWVGPLLPMIPRVKTEFLKYSRDITLDSDTAHYNLLLMKSNKKVLCKLLPQAYPDHPGRFNHYTQVLGREALGQGQHYWEVYLSGNHVSLGVCYHGISRKGHQSHCLAGRNSQSWCLEWTNTRCYAWHDGQRELVYTGQQECLGVFLDWDRGSLSFHEVSDDMPVLHRFQTSFIQPVYPIFFISWNSIVSIGEAPHAPNCVQTKRFQRQFSANF